MNLRQVAERRDDKTALAERALARINLPAKIGDEHRLNFDAKLGAQIAGVVLERDLVTFEEANTEVGAWIVCVDIRREDCGSKLVDGETKRQRFPDRSSCDLQELLSLSPGISGKNLRDKSAKAVLCFEEIFGFEFVQCARNRVAIDAQIACKFADPGELLTRGERATHDEQAKLLPELFVEGN